MNKKLYPNFFISACLFPSAFLLLTSYFAFAQAPQGINYQAVARDVAGVPLATQTVSVEFKIHQATASGAVVYDETHNKTTNAFGLFTAIIGQGTILSGTYNTIPWGTNLYFLQVFVNSIDMGTTQFLSVPYAMHASSSGNGLPPGSTGQTLFHDGTNWSATSSLFNNGSKIGIGTTTPSSHLHIFDAADPLQLSIENTGNNFKTGYRIKTAGNEWFIGQEGGSTTGFRITDIDALSVRLQIDPGGNVGIGTATPTVPLHVNNTTNQVGLQVDGSDNFWSSIYVNALTVGAQPNYGYLTGGLYKAGHRVNGAGDWMLDVNGQARVTVLANGNVGIGSTTPKSTFKSNGSMAGNFFNPTAAAYTCTNKDYFVFVTINASTITLPLANSVDPGSVIIVRNGSAGNIGLSRQGTDNLLLLGIGTPQAGVPLNAPGAGNPVGRFVSDGIGNWIEW